MSQLPLSIPTPGRAAATEVPFLNLFSVESEANAPKNRHRQRIGVNLFPLELRGGGMKQYVLQLLPLLIRNTDHEFIVYHNLAGLRLLVELRRDLTVAERSRMKMVEISHPNDIYRSAKDFDVFFCPLNGFEPQLLDRPTLATLADVQERFFPQYFSAGELAARAVVYPRVIHSVTTLITISHFSKETICSEFGADPNRIEVTHLAPNYGLLNAKSEWPAGMPKLPERFVFYAANTYPHKNHALLIEAVRLLKAQNALNFKCILSGHRMGEQNHVVQLIDKYGLKDDVIWLGHVSPNALRYLYENSLALCFPSEFEGFGMPIVEAMYLGCPVIANRAASIPEIGGDAALYVEPQPELWAQAIDRIVNDAAARDDMKARGLEQAKRFTVEQLADETIALIDQTIDKYVSEPAYERPVGYVILGGGCNRSIEHSLKSIALFAKESDEIIVLEQKSALDERVKLLISNFEQVRVEDRKSEWSASLKSDIVFLLSAGAAVMANASAAAAAAFARNEETQLAVGEVIYSDPQGDYVALSYTRFDASTTLPFESVAWRKEALRANVDAILNGQSAEAIVKALPAESVTHLSRTFATRIVWPNSPLPKRPLARRIAGRLRREASSRLRRLGVMKS